MELMEDVAWYVCLLACVFVIKNFCPIDKLITILLKPLTNFSCNKMQYAKVVCVASVPLLNTNIFLNSVICVFWGVFVHGKTVCSKTMY